jgi:hypothetical protein
MSRGALGRAVEHARIGRRPRAQRAAFGDLGVDQDVRVAPARRVEGVRQVGRYEAAEMAGPLHAGAAPEVQRPAVAEGELQRMVRVDGACLEGGSDPEHPAGPDADLPAAGVGPGRRRPLRGRHGRLRL